MLTYIMKTHHNINAPQKEVLTIRGGLTSSISLHGTNKPDIIAGAGISMTK
jgi:hypothetical protein